MEGGHSGGEEAGVTRGRGVEEAGNYCVRFSPSSSPGSGPQCGVS